MTGVYDQGCNNYLPSRAYLLIYYSLAQVQLHLAVMAAAKEKESANKLYKASEYVRSE